MRIKEFETYLNETGNPYLVEVREMPVDGRCVFSTPEKCFELAKLLKLDYKADEETWVICLNAKLHPIGLFRLAKGGEQGASFFVKEMLRTALLVGASRMLMIHNHPSGDSAPSREDISVTETIIKSSNQIGMPLLDHIIVGKYGYTSMREYTNIF